METQRVHVRRFLAPQLLLLGVVLVLNAAEPTRVDAERASSRPLTPTELYRKVAPSVVTIAVYGRDGKEVKTGSGVVIDSRGTVLTNYHVVDGGTFFDVHYAGGENATLPARPLKSAPGVDLAELAVSDPQPLQPATLSTRIPAVGTRVYALGSPFTLEGTLSEGLVSQVRSDGNRRLIQTSAAISPGSSGGGLFLENGDLVGITSMTLQGGQNLNFAVAVSELSQLRPCQSFVSAQNESAPVSETISIAGVTVALGMAEDAILSQIREPYQLQRLGFGGENYQNFGIDEWEQDTQLWRPIGSISFHDGRVTLVSRTWNLGDRALDVAEALIGAARAASMGQAASTTLNVSESSAMTSLVLRFSAHHTVILNLLAVSTPGISSISVYEILE
jgi:Trypsin-like peptidase domain